MSRKKLAPKLRFPEYRDVSEWQYKRLDELFSERNIKNHPNKQVLAATQDRGVIPYQQLEKSIIRERKNLVGYKIVFPGDFIISLRSFEGGFEYSGEEGIISPAYTIIYLKQKLNMLFFRYYFKRRKFVYHIQQILNLSLRDGKSINYKQASELLIIYPEKTEQQKIADCLSSLDELIDAHSKKLDALKEYKKGLMQQLFPAEGKTQPKLRFPEFKKAPKWKRTELEKISYNISSGKDKNLSFGKYNLYGSTGIIGKTINGTYDGKFILVARVGANAGLLTKTNGRFGVTDNTLVIQLHEDVYFDFIFSLLENYKLNNLVFGSGQPLITGSQLKAISLYLPELKEQQKIADCLSSIDENIKSQTQKIESLKHHKKGLMQQLFPSPEDIK
ncbi:MAG: restriction endonuclease subunit S [Spirochaetales bacterium]|nr:restriction endonuclease subunit S [Spirochaetales bacterium]